MHTEKDDKKVLVWWFPLLYTRYSILEDGEEKGKNVFYLVLSLFVYIYPILSADKRQI